jgi:hypothetical protein
MSTPSLLNIPYRLKAGTLYSQIPETGLGDFVVTRATTPTANLSTRVNSLGFIERVNDNVPRLDYPLGGAVNGCPALLVEPVAINSALQSENFTTTWGVSNATPTANQATSPDNTLTADRISITSNGGYIRQLLATSNSLTYTLSCFVKNDAVASGDTFRLYFNNNLGAPNAAVANATININAGTVSAGSSGAGVSSVSAGIENYGNGWYRVRLTFTLGASAGNANSEIGFEAPTATRTFFAWGAQLEVGSVATSYIPTTTQAITRGAEVINKTGIASLIGQTEGTIYAEVVLSRINANQVISLGTLNDRIMINFDSSTSVLALIRVGNVNADYTATIPAIPATGGVYKIALAYKANDYCFAVNGIAYASTASRGVPANMSTLYLGASVFSNAQLNDRIRAAALYPNRLSNTELAALTTP